MNKRYDIVVVGAGASGVVAACVAAEHGASVALIQKEATVISQGNCASAIIKSRSTEAGIAKWIHHTNSLCNWRCDTLEELAAELDIPFENMKRSIDRYNELCDGGKDLDYGKPKQYMHAIKQPPFWATRKHIRVSSICAGILTNENAQAIDSEGNIIPGLYCAGNVGGGFFGGADYPFHHTGLSLGRCFTFGMIAALKCIS